jgi:queuosine biosynthesis protein QueC
MNNSKKAVVLFSGGLDSSTVLKIALDKGYDVIPISFFYKQRHKTEIDHAKRIAKYFNIKNHIIINLDFSSIKGSALVDFNINVPKNQIKIHTGSDPYSLTDNSEKSEMSAQKSNMPITYNTALIDGNSRKDDNNMNDNKMHIDKIDRNKIDDNKIDGNKMYIDKMNVHKMDKINYEQKDNIPITYVPARNTIFLSYAIAVGEVNNAGDIFIGVNWIDYSGYPDCRPEYIHAFEQMANLATKASVTGALKFKIHTPLINMGKKDIIKKGNDIGVPLEMTHSCYDPINGLACGVCDSCILRKNGFIEAGIEDPTIYAKSTK